MPIRQLFINKLLSGFLVFLTMMLCAGCETLFKSNFDLTANNQPPAHMQEVGTANLDGPPGSVIVVPAPAAPSGKWVQIGRAGREAPVAGMQGNFSQFRGDGNYTFSAVVYMPTGSGLATIQFERLNQPLSDLSSFLHLDLTEDNHVRIDDNDSAKFGTFTRDQPFILQVTLKIGDGPPTAHIVLAGAGASGQADYTILPAFQFMAHQFGAVRLWMGFPWMGKFEATQIVVTRRTQ